MNDNDYESEIEELINPKDELKKKIVTLVGTIRDWNDQTANTRKTVRIQLAEIIDIGLNKRKMQKTELRDLVTKFFQFHGVSDSWIRKLLPEALKDSSKIPISHLQRKEIEKERQRLLLLQQQTSESKQESKSESLPAGNTAESSTFQYAEPELTLASPEGLQRLETQLEPGTDEALSFSKENQQNDIYKRIEKLEAKVLRLSEQFVARANLQALGEVPVVANIDPVEKAIIWIRLDKNNLI